MAQPWYSSSIQSVEQTLQTTVSGLSSQEAGARLEKYGPNQFAATKKKSVAAMFFSQFKDFMIIILLVAAAVSAFVANEVVDAAVILVLVVINAVIGTVQELKAEKSLEALQKMSAPSAKVVRDGKQVQIPASQLVPGDLVVLDTGDYVPADLRLTEYKSLQIQEAALTGESVPVYKEEALLPEDASLGDRSNMAFSSSLVTYGRGKGIVVETAMGTEVGKIAAMLQGVDQTQTPMQKRLAVLGKTLGMVALGVCVIMFGIGLLYGQEALHMLMRAISLAVAAIPEGLPAISTIVLALGVQRMAKRNAIVRTLPSVETLGSATVICSDKTGTLTQNKMTVVKFALACDAQPREAGDLDHRVMAQAMVLCTDAQKDEGGAYMGDPTETALVELGDKRGYEKMALEQATPRVGELPFDSDRKLMTTVHRLEDGRLGVYCKGGMDEMLAICSTIEEGEGPRPVTSEDLDRIHACNELMARQALRVLTFGVKYIEQLPGDMASLESGLTFIGMVGMIDPPRDEVKVAVSQCHTAGITPVMITGDHRITASAIAEELDILRPGGLVVEGKELEAMSDEELFDRVESISVYARVSPEHKVRIVDAWQKHGNVVAMTGDGVNDAPALKRADIGCAMGQGGTDVAKDASDLILVDDNFATVVSAVEEGRRIYDNVLKAISFLLSCNVGEIITLFLATLLNWAEPLLPIHLLLVNLVTDGLPALALGVDPAEPNIMARKARKQEKIFTSGMIKRVVYQGIMVGVITLAAFLLGLPGGIHTVSSAELSHAAISQAQTMAFVVLAMSQIVHSFNLRSKHKSVFVVHPFQNLKLVGAGALSILIVLLCVNVPGLNTVLNLTPLPVTQILEVIGLSLVPLVVVELAKLFKINTSKDEREQLGI